MDIVYFLKGFFGTDENLFSKKISFKQMQLLKSVLIKNGAKTLNTSDIVLCVENDNNYIHITVRRNGCFRTSPWVVAWHFVI